MPGQNSLENSRICVRLEGEPPTVATDEQSLATSPVSGEMDDFYPDAGDADEFPLLDVYDEQPSGAGQARLDALATISAGERVYRDERDRVGLPKVSRDGTIYLHDADGRAPGLKAALAATDNKSLTIAFPFNSLRMFWQERFSRYSATRLEVYGDGDEMREIILHGENQPPEHVVHLVGTPEYERLRKSAKVNTSLYFALAEWVGPPWSPRIVFPDGLGLYRLRTTSRHSRRNLLGQLQTASRFTGGQLAGLPFELRLTYREVPDPTGAKRNVPIWSLLFKPPSQIALSTRTWGQLRDAALAEGRVLSTTPALNAPSQETWQTAQAEGDVMAEPSDADLAMMLRGDAPADQEHWRRVWFSVTDHTIFSQDVARHKFFERYTEGRVKGLADFLKDATNEDAQAMMEAAVEELNGASGVGAPTNVPSRPQRTQAENARRYTEIFGTEETLVADAAKLRQDAAELRAEVEANLPVEHEPTPMDDILDAPKDDADDFMPDPEQPPVPRDPNAAPEDADQREATKQWLTEVHRLIAEAHRGGKSGPADPTSQRIVANLLLEATQGDVGAASTLLRTLTRGTPSETGSAKHVTQAQAVVIQSLAVSRNWTACATAALQYGNAK